MTENKHRESFVSGIIKQNPLFISMLGTCVFRLLYVFFFFPAPRSIETLLLVYPTSWVLTGIAMMTAYYLVRRHAFVHIS